MLTEDEKILAQAADFFEGGARYGFVDSNGALHL